MIGMNGFIKNTVAVYVCAHIVQINIPTRDKSQADVKNLSDGNI